MKAAFMEQFGPPEAIQYGELPEPTLGRREVLVKVAATTVNNIDAYIRGGIFRTPVPMPFIIGRDLTGVVVKVGPEVSRFRSGDRVWANNQGYAGRQGTFAEYCAIAEDLLYPLPGNADLHDSVVVFHSALTALLGLKLRIKLEPGETLFINGGDGNVGTALLQLAKSAGARVAVTSGSASKAEWCRELGADLVINYKSEPIVEALKRFAPEGVHVYWDCTRKPDLKQALQVMAQRGRLALIAGMSESALPVGPFFIRNCTLYGFTATEASAEELRSCADAINLALENNQLRAKVADRLPLSEASAAHRRVETESLFGKILLLP